MARSQVNRAAYAAAALVVAVGLGGCVAQSKVLYAWGSYEDIVYAGTVKTGTVGPEGQIQQMVASGETNEVQLRNRIPVHIAYFTAEADEKGQVRTYPDIYGLDGKVASALRGQPVHFASEPLNFSAPEASEPDPDASSWMHSGSRSRPTAERTGAERTGGERAGAERTGGERAGAERRPWNPFQDWN